jgi:hypothetical protein
LRVPSLRRCIVNNLERRQTAEERLATHRDRARFVTVMALVTWAACSVALAFVAISIEAIRLVNGIDRDAHLTTREKLASPAPGDLTDYLFLQRHLAGVEQFYLVLPKRERKNPFIGGGTRNFALFFLFPAIAVSRIGEADAAVGLDGVDLHALRAAGARIERSGDVSVQLLRSP